LHPNLQTGAQFQPLQKGIYLCVSVETQRELKLIERNVKDEMSSSSEDEEASPDIGHDICLETYTGSITVSQNTAN
jgi:hypothetical protein